MSRNFIIVKAFGSNFPHIKKTPAMSVGHILSMPSPVWNIIHSCVLCNFSFCVAVAEKKNSVCADLTLAFLAQATMRNKPYVVMMDA